MLDSYLLIPGDKTRFLKKIGELKPDYFVIDLEESVSNNNKLRALDELKELNVGQNTFVRIPFKDKVYSKDQLIFIINKFKGRIVLPKVNEPKDVKSLISLHKFTFPLKLIFLVENPTCFVNLSEIIKENIHHTHAIGFGSHDFCSIMGIKHDLEHLSFYRNQLILLAKAFGIDYIDGVDMNIRDLSEFEKECVFAFDSGADGKFIIHPDQLEKMYNIDYLSMDEINKMKEIHRRASEINKGEIDIIEFEGKVYEKPHLARIEKLLTKLNRQES